MKKVIDANYLQRPELNGYLSDSKENYVVFTDFGCMEAFKGDAVRNISRSLEIVSHFPQQVIVLKGTRSIISLKLTSKGLQQKLIDTEQTRGFREFCHQTRTAREGNIAVIGDILLKGRIASQYLEGLTDRHQVIVEGIRKLTESFKRPHLKALRTGKALPPDFHQRTMKDIVFLSALLFRGHLDIKVLPDWKDLRSQYIFRYSIGSYLVALKWIAEGGLDQVAPSKLRNDLVDTSYAVYATYFDGLLSLDRKVNELYHDIIFFLNRFTPQPDTSADG